LQISGYTLF